MTENAARLTGICQGLGGRTDVVGNYWHVYPLKADDVDWLESVGVSVPTDIAPGTAPTPDQVFAALRLFPNYRVHIRREDRKKKEKGQDVVLTLTREDGSYTVRIRLLGVHSDDRPVGVFYFEYFRETEELFRLVAKLADLCGPLYLYDDSGCEGPILVNPEKPPGQGHQSDGGEWQD
jgi:hypothetical protein